MRRTSQLNLYPKILLVVMFFCFIIVYYLFAIVPIIKTYCASQIKSLTEQTLNVAVSNVINSTINYDSIITINYNQNGEVSYMSANQYMINTIAREVVKDAHQRMKDLGSEYISVPVGTLSGITLFMGRGPMVKLSSSPIAIVGSSFDSTFTSVGINNTLHKIYLKVNATVEMTLPIKKQTIEVEQEVLLCESVIVGNVPKVYFNSGMSDSLLNLVP